LPSWDTIGITAHYTAQVWVREGLPWAWRFDTAKGRLLYDALEPLCKAARRFGLTTPPDFLVQRHRMLDALVQRRAPAQLVELACGLSPRGLALSHKQGIRCVDVDLPPMVQHKTRLAGAGLPAGYHLAALDLIASRDYVRDLGPALEPVSPTVVITEGILPYFPLVLQRHVFGCIAALLRACGGGTYLTDVHHQQEVDRLPLDLGARFRWLQHLLARSPRYPMIADDAQGRAMLLDAGFQQVVVHHPGEWQEELDLPVRRIHSGLRVYEASV
jgi:O-methyltransferase involved in polyketide biosynthesis